MGLLNIAHTQMTQSIIDLQSDLLKNPFYLFNDKKALPVEYFNLNTTMSTLDQALKIPYANLGQDSPLRFNLIHDFYLYGIDRMALNLENGDFGIEASEITGDAIILPDTITPYPGDYFCLNMLKKTYLFRIIEVSTDTFENGGNYWKISYKFEYLDNKRLLPLVVDEFNFVTGNIGTNYASVLKKSKWDVAKALDDAAVMLKNYYRSLYYNNKVQTFTFVYLYQVCRTNINSDFFYDPYLIEFIIKNKILANSGGKYEYIDHKTHLRADFPIKYNRSIWRVLETRNRDDLTSCKKTSPAIYINDPSTIFYTRYENYFEMNYNDPDQFAEQFSSSIPIIDPQVIGHILNNQPFAFDSMKYAKYNLLIKYFNYEDIKIEDILPLDRFTETDNNQENYFLIPMLIYVMERYIKELMASVQDSET